MYENVLVGVDGRPGGRDAIALSQRLLSEGGTLTLAHVRSGRLHPLHAVTPELVREEHEASERLLESEREQAGVEAELVSVLAATAGAGLHQQAEEQRAGLIVVGSCSRGALGRATLGDDTRAALNGSPCAVAIAGHGYAEHPLPLAKFGVAYNGSQESVGALQEARELASRDRAEVIALEVVSIPTYAFTGLVSPALGETIESMLEQAGERMGKLDGVTGRAVYGVAGEELAAFSDEVDMLVVGSRSYGPVKRLVLGSTSDYLQRHARCSLLVLPRAVTAAPDDGPARSAQPAA